MPPRGTRMERWYTHQTGKTITLEPTPPEPVYDEEGNLITPPAQPIWVAVMHTGDQ